MSDLPSGTVTFLFTDIEGSTALWERDREAMRAAVERHLAILREAVAAHGGVLFKVVGDATQAAFPTAPEAIAAALAAQRALASAEWGVTGPFLVRMALHAGEATPDARGDYLAAPLNRLARLLAAGPGGQVLVSQTVQQLSRGQLPAGASLHDLGEHQLRDLQDPERVFQLQHPALAGAMPPLRTLDARAHHLPLHLTPLVGREDEIRRIRELLADEGARLVTLTGAGGTGKTRVAVAVAAAVVAAFPDGVWFVDLAPLTDAALVLSTIASALGVRDTGPQPLPDAVSAHLVEKRLLLVLDNFEHLLAAAPVVSELLQAGPGVAALVTSRESLQLRGEREVAILPLPVPGVDAHVTLEELARVPAVALFVQRAQAVTSEFALTAENAEAVAAICRRLDGLPLALELAAARIKVLPAQALLARLDRRLPLLTGGARDAPARQQTLRDAIAWSHDLLDGPEQVLFRRLSVFAGGATLEAADAVAGPDLHGDVFAGLSSLVDQNLVRQIAGTGEPRFAMLETIREFAAEQLARSGELQAMRRAHATYVCQWVEMVEPLLTGAEQERWLARLEAELDNVRTALAWALEEHDATTAQRLASAAYELWDVRGLYREAQTWLDRSLADPRPSLARAKALHIAGTFAAWQGELERAWVLSEESLTLAKDLSADEPAAHALTMLGNVADIRGDHARAEALHAEALAIYRRLGYDRHALAVLINLAIAVSGGGEIARATALQEEALAGSRQIRDKRLTASALISLGELARARGEREEARKLAQEALAVNRELDDKARTAGTLAILGQLANDDGDSVQAASLLDEALELVQGLGRKALGLWVVEQVARTAMILGQVDRARRLYGAAAALRESMQVPVPAVERPEYERLWSALGTRREEHDVTDGWAAGRTLSWAQAVAEARSVVEAVTARQEHAPGQRQTSVTPCT